MTAEAPAGAARIGAVGAGTALAIAAAAGYGLNAVTAQIAAQAGIGGALLVFYRVFLMLACIGALALALKPDLSVDARERGPLLVFGLTSTVVGTAYLSSIAHLPVSVAAVVFYLFPILIVLAEPLVERRRFAPARLGVALLAFLGVALVVGPQFGSLSLTGLSLALVAALGAAAQFFAAARMPRTSSSAKLLWGHLIVLPGVALTLWWIDGFAAPSALAAAPLAAFVTLAAYLVSIALQLMALARIPASVAGLAFCAEPIFASLFAALLLGERLLPLQYLGGGLVVLAIALNTLVPAGRRS